MFRNVVFTMALAFGCLGHESHFEPIFLPVVKNLGYIAKILCIVQNSGTDCLCDPLIGALIRIAMQGLNFDRRWVAADILAIEIDCKICRITVFCRTPVFMFGGFIGLGIGFFDTAMQCDKGSRAPARILLINISFTF